MPASVTGVRQDKDRYNALELVFDESRWESIAEPFDRLLAGIVEGWKQKSTVTDGGEDQGDLESGE